MQVQRLFPSAQSLGEPVWTSVVKIGQSLYREAPGMDIYRPDQATPVHNFFLAGSYTAQGLHRLHVSLPLCCSEPGRRRDMCIAWQCCLQ